MICSTTSVVKGALGVGRVGVAVPPQEAEIRADGVRGGGERGLGSRAGGHAAQQIERMYHRLAALWPGFEVERVGHRHWKRVSSCISAVAQESLIRWTWWGHQEALTW